MSLIRGLVRRNGSRGSVRLGWCRLLARAAAGAVRPGVLDELKPGPPADQENGEEDAGDDDEGQLYASACQHPQGHPTDDGSQPHGDPGS